MGVSGYYQETGPTFSTLAGNYLVQLAINVPILDDTLVEGNETVNVTLSTRYVTRATAACTSSSRRYVEPVA